MGLNHVSLRQCLAGSPYLVCVASLGNARKMHFLMRRKLGLIYCVSESSLSSRRRPCFACLTYELVCVCVCVPSNFYYLSDKYLNKLLVKNIAYHECLVGNWDRLEANCYLWVMEKFSRAQARISIDCLESRLAKFGKDWSIGVSRDRGRPKEACWHAFFFADLKDRLNKIEDQNSWCNKDTRNFLYKQTSALCTGC